MTKPLIKIMSVFGTRPEAVKMCPLIRALENTEGVESIVCLTGQHREMLQQVIDIFGIKIKYNFDIMKPQQTLTTITSSILERIEPVLILEKPALVLVHGDTTTSFVVALAAFYQKIPVGHVEAGLRTFDKYSPFPEEMNRSLTGKIAELHFAPTIRNKENLIQENITDNIFITGNTVIDAFSTTVREDYKFKNAKLNELDFEKKKCILITAHRRENLGEPLQNICNAIKELSRRYREINFVYPVHLNPAVKTTALEVLGQEENVYLVEPLDVEDMHNLIKRSYLVMTDSGGLQEEAPAFGVPVLVLRTETERPEAVEAGTVKVVGVEEKKIIEATATLIDKAEEHEKMARAVNPYGDGQASKRIIKSILEWYRS